MGTTIAEKIDALLEGGSIPSADKLKARIPPGLVEITRIPGLGPKRARLLYDQLEVASLDGLREAAEAGRLKDVKGFGKKAEDNVLAALAAGADGREKPRLLLSKALAVGEEMVAALRRPPRRAAGGARRQRAPPGGHRQGPRHRGRLQRPGGPGRGLLRARGRRPGAHLGRGGREGGHPLRAAGGPADRSRGGVRKPAAALHRLGTAQRGAAHRGGQARPARERVRHRRRRQRRQPRLRERGGGLRAAGDAVHPARAAGGPRRAGRRPLAVPAGADRARATSGATCTCTPCSPTGATPLEEMAAGRAWRAATSTWRSPTTRRATASATTCSPTSCGARSSTSAPSTCRISRCWRAPRPTSFPTARSTTTTICSASWTGWSPACTPPSGWTRTSRPTACSRRWSTRSWTRSAIPPGG